MNEPLTKKLLVFEADHLWINENLETLLEQYAEQWIAVENGQVIAGDSDLDGLISRLADPAHTRVEFITDEPLGMVLCHSGSLYRERALSMEGDGVRWR